MKRYFVMGFIATILTILFLAGPGFPSKRTVQGTNSPPVSKFVNKEDINDALHVLSRALASALYDPSLRIIIKSNLDKAFRKDRGFKLKEILAYSLASIDELKKAIGEVNVVKKAYIVDKKKNEGIFLKDKFLDSLSIGIFNHDLWSAESIALYVAAIPFDIEDEKLSMISAYNYAGGVMYLDPNKQPERELLVLRIDDDVVRPPVVGPDESSTHLVTTTSYPKYVATPVIYESGITDIHESDSGPPFNGPYGFAYFDDAPSEKAGNLVSSIGGDSGWDMNVWASNLQGWYPEYRHERHQYEFSANGQLEISTKKYPHMYGIKEVSSSSDFASFWFKIMEDDDFLNPDDFVGYAYFNYRPCHLEVFQQGLVYGWTATQTSSGSDDVSYTTYKIFCECKNLPSAPTHISPPSGSQATTLTPVLEWNSVETYPVVTQYGVEVRKTSDSSIVCSTNTTATHVELPPLEDDTQYKWRVRALSAEGWGPFSGYWTFILPAAAVPAQVSLRSPANNSTVGSLTPTMRWYAPEAFPEVDRYQARLLLNGAVVQDLYVTGLQAQFSTLLRNTKYTWKVRAENAIGWGAWSTTWSFWTPK